MLAYCAAIVQSDGRAFLAMGKTLKERQGRKWLASLARNYRRECKM